MPVLERKKHLADLAPHTVTSCWLSRSKTKLGQIGQTQKQRAIAQFTI